MHLRRTINQREFKQLSLGGMEQCMRCKDPLEVVRERCACDRRYLRPRQRIREAPIQSQPQQPLLTSPPRVRSRYAPRASTAHPRGLRDMAVAAGIRPPVRLGVGQAHSERRRARVRQPSRPNPSAIAIPAPRCETPYPQTSAYWPLRNLDASVLASAELRARDRHVGAACVATEWCIRDQGLATPCLVRVPRNTPAVLRTRRLQSSLPRG